MELEKAQKLLVWTKILVPAAPQIGSIDLEGRKMLLMVLVLPAFHTLLDTHSACTVSFPSPLSHQASSMCFSMTVDTTCLVLMGISRKKKDNTSLG